MLDCCPIKGESKTHICLALQKQEISAVFMGLLACKGLSLAYYCSVKIFFVPFVLIILNFLVVKQFVSKIYKTSKRF